MTTSRLAAWRDLGNLTAEGEPAFVLPPDLSVLSDEEVAALHEQAITEFDRLLDESAPVAELTGLADAVDIINGEQARRTEQAEADATARADLLARVHPPEEPSATDVPPADPDDPEDPEEPTAEAEQATEPVPVLAAATAATARPAAAAVRRAAPRAAAPPARVGVSITAAADLPGITTGSRLGGLDDVARAAQARAATLSDHSSQMPIARMHLPFPDALTASGNRDDDWAVIERITGREAQANLLASGGWCAPPTPLYDLYGIDAADGLIDLPTVRVTRGGLMIPQSPDLSDAMSAPWLWTAANDENPTTPATKPCVKVPCTTWDECTLDAAGICVTAGNLQDRAFPEMGRRFVQLVLNANAHIISKRTIDAIVAASGAAVNVTECAGSGISGELLSALDLAAADYKSKYRMSDNAVLEVFLPSWARNIVRADLARRAGVDLLNVSDAQIDGYFRTRSVSAQFLQDYLPLSPAGGAAVVTWPATIDFVIYSAGTYVRGDGGTLDLGVVRDSTMNETNDFTLMWTEQFMSTCKVGYESRLYQVAAAACGVTACCA